MNGLSFDLSADPSDIRARSEIRSAEPNGYLVRFAMVQWPTDYRQCTSDAIEQSASIGETGLVCSTLELPP